MICDQDPLRRRPGKTSSEVAADGVTVNMVIPGGIHTERVDELDAAASKRLGRPVDDVAAASRATILVQRYGQVEEFAAVGAFLASARQLCNRQRGALRWWGDPLGLGQNSREQEDERI